jgi:citrate lyase beta subunit
VAAVVVPKVEDAGLLATVDRPLLPLVESAAGFDALLLFRWQLVLVSRRARLAAPVDGVTTAVDAEAAVTHDTPLARLQP